MENRNIPFGLAIGTIVSVAVAVGAGIYWQGVSFSDRGSSGAPVAERMMAQPKEALLGKVPTTVSTQTYSNPVYGFEFTYPAEMEKVETPAGDSAYSLSISENDNWIFQVNTQTKNPGGIDFYNIPNGTDVDDWIIKSQGKAYKDEGGGYFSNKAGATFDISGLKTLHLVSRQLQGGSYDEFYFVKDGRLYVLTIVNSPSMRGDLSLNDDSQWYTQLLKSFRFTDVPSVASEEKYLHPKLEPLSAKKIEVPSVCPASYRADSRAVSCYDFVQENVIVNPFATFDEYVEHAKKTMVPDLVRADYGSSLVGQELEKKVEEKLALYSGSYEFWEEMVDGHPALFHRRNFYGFAGDIYEMHIDTGNGSIVILSSEIDNDILNTMYHSYKVSK